MSEVLKDASVFPKIAATLNLFLPGSYLQDAFYKPEEECSLVFLKGKEQNSLSFNTQTKGALLFFYEYQLDRPDSVQPIFKSLIGQKVSEVKAFESDRAWEIVFENHAILTFLHYGAQANVLLRNHDGVSQLFRGKILTQRQWTPLPYAQALPEPNPMLVAEWHSYATTHLHQYLFSHQKTMLVKQLSQQVKRKEAELNATQNRLVQLETEIPPEEIGHLVMANLHHIQKGDTQVTVHDFYRNQPLEIKLKKDLSGADNAAYYYRKSKNRKEEEKAFAKKAILVGEQLTQLKQQLDRVNNAQSLKELKPLLPKETKGKLPAPVERFKVFTVNGFQVLVGKNAENNDELTLKYAKKDDLWLHARGVQGSHVVIKQQAGKPIPKEVLEVAASLAAYYSKAKGSGLVPVIFTPKKFVRKPKGANPGQVKVEREEVLMAEPKLPAND